MKPALLAHNARRPTAIPRQTPALEPAILRYLGS